jgi:hypothetical protein
LDEAIITLVSVVLDNVMSSELAFKASDCVLRRIALIEGDASQVVLLEPQVLGLLDFAPVKETIGPTDPIALFRVLSCTKVRG